MVAKKQDKKPVEAKEKKVAVVSPSEYFTKWLGSVQSLLVHTVFFVGAFVSIFFGVPTDKVLLVLTTVVSLEAIYLAIFIQMTVNRQAESLEEVEEDIDEIQKDVDEIQEDIDEIQEDIEEEDKDKTLDTIESDLKKLVRDISLLRQKNHPPQTPPSNTAL